MPNVTKACGRSTSEFEFVALFASLTSLTALALSMMLPALSDIGRTFSAEQDVHKVVSTLVLGMVFGELFFGPLADARGRKSAILIGIALFIAGSLIAMLASSLTMLLFGRLLQGIGVAGPKIGSRAAIRDRYAGGAMARTMSLIMTVLVLVPMLAPVLGEWVLELGSWRFLFGAYAGLSLLAALWLYFRQPETLGQEDRLPFSVRGSFVVALRILMNAKVLAYTLAAGLLFGAQLSYYGVAQSIFSITYQRAELFTTFFALLAFAVGAASLINAKLVLRLGTAYLARTAVMGLVLSSGVLLVSALLSNGTPPLWIFVGLCAGCFFCIGILFGNLGAMAMESLGAVAGIGASIIASVSSLVAVLVSNVLGSFHDETLVPLGICFVAVGMGTLLLVGFATRRDDVEVLPYRPATA
ncbi:MFS transporter [Granulosicoccus antarcticus]|uniref:Bicyclomycin resistance protein n=1 Tax=Granulosicoccus antarcticus IMCC3135 TaxID=1192854 RepID=A0A2Z2NUV3_9GAMM|nr:MFS transporter [Granulosicoccus antarcticus]ASJ73791.1 Bicyclomycin resistance protein [Granulosicoccus antarcticus IMCC3135]